jgi:hypothetical protein
MAGADHKFRELDDLVLDLKGLVLVRSFREQQGADAGELEMYRAEIDRVRDRLTNLVTANGLQEAAA